MHKISRSRKQSTLVDNLYLESVEEAKMKKQLDILNKRQKKIDPRKSKITRMVNEFFSVEKEDEKDSEQNVNQITVDAAQSS